MRTWPLLLIGFGALLLLIGGSAVALGGSPAQQAAVLSFEKVFLLSGLLFLGVLPLLLFLKVKRHGAGAPKVAVLACEGACIKGEIPKLLLAEKRDRAKELALHYRGLFGPGNYYFEIMNHGLADEATVSRALVSLGKELGIPVVATNDSPHPTVASETLHAAGRAGLDLSRDGRQLLVWASRKAGAERYEELLVFDLFAHTSRAIATHGQRLEIAAIDPSGRIVVTGDVDGVVAIIAGRYRATFLPRVWDDLPDPEQFLRHLWLKAGFTPGVWYEGTRLETYTVRAWGEDGSDD